MDLRPTEEQTPEEIRHREFLRMWQVTELPACDEGMILLRKFAEASPTLFEIALRNSFIDPTHPRVRRNPLWVSFADHVSTCEKCNEV